eukprot:722446-Hanusia_phi.AAC.2
MQETAAIAVRWTRQPPPGFQHGVLFVSVSLTHWCTSGIFLMRDLNKQCSEGYLRTGDAYSKLMSSWILSSYAA